MVGCVRRVLSDCMANGDNLSGFLGTTFRIAKPGHVATRGAPRNSAVTALPAPKNCRGRRWRTHRVVFAHVYSPMACLAIFISLCESEERPRRSGNAGHRATPVPLRLKASNCPADLICTHEPRGNVAPPGLLWSAIPDCRFFGHDWP